MQQNISLTQTNGRKTSIGARSPPRTPSLLSLCRREARLVQTCHDLIKELAIRRIEHRSEIHSNGSRHLAEGTEVARLRRRFSLVLQQALSFRTKHHICRQGAVLADIRQLRSHSNEGATRSEKREGADGDGDGDGVGAETGTGEETRERRQRGNRDGEGTETRAVAETGTGTGRDRKRKGTDNGEGKEEGGRRRVRGIIIISIDRRWRLQVASMFWRKTRRLPDDVVSREEQDTNDGKDKTVTGTRKRTRTRTGMSTRAGMGARTGTINRTETRVEGTNSLGTFEVVMYVWSSYILLVFGRLVPRQPAHSPHSG